MRSRRARRVSSFFRVRDALAQIDADYDVVVIDCPPQLGFLTMSALSAATGVLVTIHPEMLDVMSMSQFLRMTADLMDVIAESGADMSHDWMRYLLTRYEPTDAPQNRIVAFLRTMYGDKVLKRADAEIHRDFGCRAHQADPL